MKLSKSVRFALNAMNAVKKNIYASKKFFSPLKRWKKIFHRYQQNAVTKNFAPLKLQILQIFTAKINAYLKFAGNITEVSERWRSGIRSWWHGGGKWFKPVYGSSFFVRNPVNAVKEIIWQRNTTQFLQIFTTFSAFHAKICGRFAVKLVQIRD